MPLFPSYGLPAATSSAATSNKSATTPRIPKYLLSLAVSFCLSLVFATTTMAATFIVNTVSDDVDDNAGDGTCATALAECSLRAAIEEANQLGGSHLVEFAIDGGGAQTIVINSSLPSVVTPVVFDATTQPEYAGIPLITIDGGQSVTTGIQLGALSGGSAVRGFNIIDFTTSGVTIDTGSDSNEITGNWVGIDDIIATPGSQKGIVVGSSSNTIGGTGPNEYNVVSENNTGIEITQNGTLNTIISNFVGTNSDGTTAIGNRTGIRLSGTSNTVGGDSPEERNLISGNSYAGIHDTGTNNVIIGNYIGTTADGLSALGNERGIVLGIATATPTGKATNNVIGRPNEGEGNLISGNTNFGVFLFAGDTTIQNNYFGTDLTGNVAIPSENGNGIFVGNGTLGSIKIGGNNPDEGNIIVTNTYNPLYINAGTNVVIQGNYIGIGADQETSLPSNDTVYGIVIQGNSSNVVIGTPSGDANVDLGARNYLNASNGINLDGVSTATIRGNYIGLDPTGEIEVGESDSLAGISVASATAVDSRENVIVNTHDGVRYIGVGGSDIQGNYIGTNATAETAIGLTGNGVRISSTGTGGANNIGGLDLEDSNIIAGVLEEPAIYLEAVSALTELTGNYIGTNSNFDSGLGNGGDGIYVSNSLSVSIGGTGPNFIVNNAGNGVVVDETSRSVMLAQNLIYDNQLLGIDLGDDGFTINDSDDTDTGANLKQNYPVLEEVDVQLTTVEVTGFLRSSASTEFVIEFYADQSPVNPTGFGQGEILLGVEPVETDGFGLAQFNYSFNIAVDANSKISAVAINLETGDTSEFGFDPTSLLPVTETIPAPTYILNSNTSLNLTNLDLSEDYEYSIILQNTESPDYVTEGGSTDFYVGEDGTLQACLNTQFCGDAYKFLATDFPLEVSGLEGLYEPQSYFIQYLAIDTDIAQTALHTSPVTQVQPSYWILTDATYDKALNLTEFTIGDTLYFAYANPEFANDAVAEDTLNITITTTGGDQEILQLVETADTGGFTASITTDSETPVTGSNSLQISADQVLTASISLSDSTETILDDFSTYQGTSNLFSVWSMTPMGMQELVDAQYRYTDFPGFSYVDTYADISDLPGLEGAEFIDVSNSSFAFSVRVNDVANFAVGSVENSLGEDTTGFTVFLQDGQANLIKKSIFPEDLLNNEFVDFELTLDCTANNFTDMTESIGEPAEDNCPDFDFTDVRQILFSAAKGQSLSIQFTVDDIILLTDIESFDVITATALAGEVTPPPVPPRPQTSSGSISQAPSVTAPVIPVYPVVPTVPVVPVVTPTPTTTPTPTRSGESTSQSSSSGSSSSSSGSRVNQDGSISLDQEFESLFDLESLIGTDADPALEANLPAEYRMQLAYTGPTNIPNSQFLIPGTIYSTGGPISQVCFALIGNFNFDIGCSKVKGFKSGVVNYFAHTNNKKVPNGTYRLRAMASVDGRTLIDEVQVVIGGPAGIPIELVEFTNIPAQKLQVSRNKEEGIKAIAVITIKDKPYVVLKTPVGENVKVETYWQSVTINTSALADTLNGLTFVQVPDWFDGTPGSSHKLTAYAYDINNPSDISDLVTVDFKIKSKFTTYSLYFLIPIALLVLLLLAMKYVRRKRLAMLAADQVVTPESTIFTPVESDPTFGNKFANNDQAENQSGDQPKPPFSTDI